ncbi:ABC transporter transmembrane domain-containing protein [Buchnera aphidicola]|uniref:Multidrug resistance-like ATP-binding protein MdlA n=1 Tax=Buchnera aphidicola subsp. Tuberolachnus salignus TaxID=98804 RepID=A0A161K2G5_BUCTT|nr:ABC transporter transmembrane domain-containing protein [Buchnera aphidicola]CUR53283.1 Multidrug resistance-like ATP-binding protein MdlA [Buchnera aphidicola (Tuberolachnus salignus)]
MKLFKQLSWYFKKEWKRYLGAFFLLTSVTILQLFPSTIIGKIIDDIYHKNINNTQTLQWMCLVVLISGLIYILRYFWRILLFGASYKLATELRTKFCTSLIYKNAKFYNTAKNGDLMAKVTNDIDKVVFAAGEGVLTLIDSLVLGCSVFLTMCIRIDYKLSLASLLPLPIMAFIVKKFGKKIHICYQKSQKSFSLLTNYTQDCLSNISMIRSFGLEKKELEKFSILSDNTSQKNLNITKIDAQFDPIIYLAISISNLIAVLGGSLLISQHKITFGQLTSFLLYLGTMIWPMLALAWLFNIVERGSVSWERIQTILSEKKHKNSQKKITLKKIGILNVQIKNFKYPIRHNNTLHKINFKLLPGKILGICGPTGAGKTTLIKIIQGIYTNKNSIILYDQYNINNISKKNWRKHISVVEQSPLLFSDNILNNISFGKSSASENEIINAAKLSEIHDEIKNFSEGYNTYIGEGGVSLSGGQKQRIAIARAFLTSPKLLILDDPLSAVDNETEQKILKNLYNQKLPNQTFIIISHKLSILKKADFIIVIKNGVILQKGTHELLMKEENWYQKMYHYQKFKT